MLDTRGKDHEQNNKRRITRRVENVVSSIRLMTHSCLSAFSFSFPFWPKTTCYLLSLINCTFTLLSSSAQNTLRVIRVHPFRVTLGSHEFENSPHSPLFGGLLVDVRARLP